jgi:hypothetical protein
LAHGPVRFGEDSWLAGSRYSAGELQAGDGLEIALDWRGAPPAASVVLAPPGREFPAAQEVPCALCVPAEGGSIATSAQLPPGLYLPQVAASEPVYSPSGQPRGTLYLRPVRVRPGTAAPPPGAPAAQLGSVELVLADGGPFALPSGGVGLQAELYWTPQSEPAANYGLSLRLIDAAGRQWAARDTIAGSYGFYPSALWRPGATVLDRAALPVPEGLPPAAPYTLTVTLYDIPTLAPLGTAALQVTWDQATIRPGLELIARFEGLGLHRLDVPESAAQGAELDVAAYFAVLAGPPLARVARWTLLGPGGEAAYLVETPLAPGADAGRWPRDAYVLARHALRLPAELAPGVYTLRLSVLDASGRLLGEYAAPRALTISGQARVFDLPPVAVPVGADYGGLIRLHGYSLSRDETSLSLEPVWQALAAPGRDYKVFVHLFDPAAEAIVAQHDAPPRDGRYPTSQWVAGEVVSDTIRIDLGGVPPGTYRLGVGLYDESGRLGERVVLADEIVVR